MAIPEGLDVCRQVCSGGAADAKYLLCHISPATHSRGMRPLRPSVSQQRYGLRVSIFRLCRIPLECPCANPCSRHFALTTLSLRQHCIPAYTHLIPKGIMSSPLLHLPQNCVGTLLSTHRLKIQFIEPTAK